MNKVFLFIFASLFISSNALAQWKLVNDDSSLNFISVKKSKVAEVHHFNALKGIIDDNGNISVSVDLNSVETNISIRNERMKSMLFETSKFSTAQIKSSLDPKKLATMNAGDSLIQSMSFNASLHGIANIIKTDVRIIKLNNKKLLAVSVKPIIINADKYKLIDGIELLRTAAKLPSISTAIPVSFSFMFQQ